MGGGWAHIKPMLDQCGLAQPLRNSAFFSNSPKSNPDEPLVSGVIEKNQAPNGLHSPLWSQGKEMEGVVVWGGVEVTDRERYTNGRPCYAVHKFHIKQLFQGCD